jgi:hypothetical protein
MPGEGGVGPDHAGGLLQRLLTQCLAGLGRRLAPPIAEGTRPLIWCRRIRFSVIKCSFRTRSS